jgi:hypothetical protein
VVDIASLFAGIDVDSDCFHEALKAHQASMPEQIGLMLQQFVLRGCLTAAYWTSTDSIRGIAKRFWDDLMPFRRDQKLFPHLGEAGTAVFAVQEIEYGGHDLTSFV